MTDYEKGRIAGIKQAAAMARLMGKEYHEKWEAQSAARKFDESFIESCKLNASGEINQAIIALMTPRPALTPEHHARVCAIQDGI